MEYFAFVARWEDEAERGEQSTKAGSHRWMSRRHKEERGWKRVKERR